jgi:replicative DNA helicase
MEAEQEVLGALIGRPDTFAQVASILAPEHFSEPLHGVIYAACKAAFDAGQPSSLAIIRQHIGASDFASDLGGLTLGGYVGKLMAASPSGIGLTAHARMVRDLWALRQLAAVADDIGRDASEGFEPSAYLGDRFAAVDEIRAALLDRERSSTTAGNAGAGVVAKIEATLKGSPDPLPCSGIPRLDDEIGGFQPSNLIVEAARPGVGKSLVGIEVCDAMTRDGFGCAYFSLEMSGRQVASRIIASRLEREGMRVPFRDVLRGTVHHSVAERVASIAHDMRADPLWIEEAGGVTIGEIAATAERRMNGFARKGVPLGAVFIDHCHKVVSARRDSNGEAVVREVSGGALAIAKRLGVPVFLLAQLNRQTEGREDKRPGPADLRGSGALEEDADVLLFLYRPGFYVEQTPEYRRGDADRIEEYERVRHELEIIISKNRTGRSNVVVPAFVDTACNALRPNNWRGIR